MAFLDVRDTLSGGEGVVQATINGKIEQMFYVKNVEAKMEKDKSDLKVFGSRVTQAKNKGWKGTGSMTMFYMTSVFRKLALAYAKTGKDFYFDMLITNEDTTTGIGKQTVVLRNCNLDSILLAKVDIESEALDEDVDFTFTDWDLLDEFGKPSYIK